MNGVIVIDKPSGMTSQAVVSRVKHLFGAKKAGHGGTLDPMATGVLPVMVGNSVGASQYIASEDKRYYAGIKFGIQTDSEDISGNIIATCTDPVPTQAQLEDACKGFIGEIMQTPPMYSALKVGGRKLVDLARKGIEVEREARKIIIYSINVSRLGEDFFLDVHCGKGTYIRTLCADIGRSLGTYAVMSSLRRTSAGMFSLSDAVTLEQLEAMTISEREKALIPNEKLFASFPPMHLGFALEKPFRNGAMIPLSEVSLTPSQQNIWRVYDTNGFIAIGECIYREGEMFFKVKKFFI